LNLIAAERELYVGKNVLVLIFQISRREDNNPRYTETVGNLLIREFPFPDWTFVSRVSKVSVEWFAFR